MAINLTPSVTISHNLNRDLSRVSEQVASGRRINSAADDVAGFGIAVDINTRIRSQDSAMSNAINGISLVQTAQAGLSQVSDGLQQLREIGIQASNGTLTDANRASLQQQANQILAGIQDTLASTRFNGQQPLSADGSIELQVGESASDRFSIPSRDMAAILDGFGLNSIDLTDTASLVKAIDSIDQSLDAVLSTAAEFGASQTRLTSAFSNLEGSNLNQAASVSQIEDADLAKSISELISLQLLQRSQIALQAQANAQRGQVLSLLDLP